MATKITQAKADAEGLVTPTNDPKATKKEPPKTDSNSKVQVKAETEPQTKPQTKMQAYTVQWTLNYNNQSYLTGSEIELDDITAKPLLASGVLVAK